MPDSAAAAQAAPDSILVVPVTSDSSVVVEVPAAESTAVGETTAAQVAPALSKRAQAAARKQKRAEPPYRVVLRSLFYPGWGQMCNKKPLKALAVFAAEGTILGMIYSESRAASRAYDKHLEEPDGARAAELYADYERHFERQETFTWWAAGLVLLSLADAYVDAHLYTFEDEFGEPEGGGGKQGGPDKGTPRAKVGVSFQPDPSLSGGFLRVSCGF